MQKIVELILEKSPVDYITTDLLHMILGGSKDRLYSIVKRALASKDLVRVRRGLYVLGEKYRRFKISEVILSQRIYSPSYLSFEYALSFHGLIPDIVQRVLSASYYRSQVFETQVGIYEYYHIPLKPFFLGVQRHKNQFGNGFLIAGPERALCDLIYKKKIKWVNISVLVQGYRVEEEELLKFNQKLLIDVADNYPVIFVKKFINKLVKEINNVL
ncbi:MAG: type IV toxin-antitoxin system AbiEi family antitoxin domain-containing protein [bacterium]